jgi:hypothetical protein
LFAEALLKSPELLLRAFAFLSGAQYYIRKLKWIAPQQPFPRIISYDE